MTPHPAGAGHTENECSIRADVRLLVDVQTGLSIAESFPPTATPTIDRRPGPPLRLRCGRGGPRPPPGRLDESALLVVATVLGVSHDSESWGTVRDHQNLPDRRYGNSALSGRTTYWVAASSTRVSESQSTTSIRAGRRPGSSRSAVDDLDSTLVDNQSTHPPRERGDQPTRRSGSSRVGRVQLTSQSASLNPRGNHSKFARISSLSMGPHWPPPEVLSETPARWPSETS